MTPGAFQSILTAQALGRGATVAADSLSPQRRTNTSGQRDNKQDAERNSITQHTAASSSVNKPPVGDFEEVPSQSQVPAAYLQPPPQGNDLARQPASQLSQLLIGRTVPEERQNASSALPRILPSPRVSRGGASALSPTGPPSHIQNAASLRTHPSAITTHSADPDASHAAACSTGREEGYLELPPIAGAASPNDTPSHRASSETPSSSIASCKQVPQQRDDSCNSCATAASLQAASFVAGGARCSSTPLASRKPVEWADVELELQAAQSTYADRHKEGRKQNSRARSQLEVGLVPLIARCKRGEMLATQALRSLTAKLCDFGCAIHAPRLGNKPIGKSGKGSTSYCAPEVAVVYLQGKHRPVFDRLWPQTHSIFKEMHLGYDATAADVWSFGITLFVIASGNLPFRVASVDSSTFRAFVVATQPAAVQMTTMAPHTAGWPLNPSTAQREWSWPQGFSPALIHLLGGCLTVQSTQRFTMEQVKVHPWFGSPSWLPG
jgi:hypothetical protein